MGAMEFEPDTGLTNDDLKPTMRDQRTLTGWEMASLWVGIVIGVPNYYLAGSLVELGMSWWEGMLTVTLGNLIILFPLLSTGHAGAEYGIPYPVFVRASFGVRGAHIATVIRGLVACGWFGIETWIGGQAILLLVPDSLKPASLSRTISWLDASLLQLAFFFLFWILQVVVIWKGMDGVRRLQKYSAPILIILAILLLVWAYVRAGGFGSMLSTESTLTPSEFWRLFFPCLTACVGTWSTMALSIPDFTRFARSQGDQALGQAIGMPLSSAAYAFIGLAVTSSTQVIFGETISNPILLLPMISTSVPIILISIVGITLAVLTTNVAANVVAPANAIVNLNPARFGFRGGALVTAVIGILFQPWRLYGSSETYVDTWLVGCSALLGPVAGIVVVDYWVLRRGVLDVGALYSMNPVSPYWYFRGFNLAAIAAMVVPVLVVIPGFLYEVGILNSVPAVLVGIYDVAWFITFFSAGALYWILSSLWGRTKMAQVHDPLLLNSSP
ncbi:purine-uracil permease NCS1-like [Nymphaea colorata]|nr:purine-uracil permease NCS1-like [Nymphaea colorata]